MVTAHYVLYVLNGTLTIPIIRFIGVKLNNLLCGHALASFALHYIVSGRQQKLGFVLLAEQGIADECSQTHNLGTYFNERSCL